NVVIFGLNLFVFPDNRGSEGLGDWFALSTPEVLHGQVWRLVTYAFLHDTHGLGHIAFNMIALWIFGRGVEAIYGSREFLLFYLTGALAAGVGNVVLDVILGSASSAVGASGAVMATSMLYAMYYPRHQIWIFGILPIEMRWLVVLYVGYDLLPVVRQLQGIEGSDGVAHAAHLSGLLYGFLYKHFDLRYTRGGEPRGGGSWNIGRLWRNWTRRRSVRIYHPETNEQPAGPTRAELSAQVDALLQKISEQGEASLTETEREFLRDASRRLREGRAGQR
ncbi:MAG TPA: rhomboid family intramembrane serine protease, partial [Planctomycetaceae bacterium]|nr:rhomboid family intramembrane serine protease [Planctomycetaceae bacterium]